MKKMIALVFFLTNCAEQSQTIQLTRESQECVDLTKELNSYTAIKIILSTKLYNCMLGVTEDFCPNQESINSIEQSIIKYTNLYKRFCQ